MKILSVDDNPQNQKLIQSSLESQFEVLSCDGSEDILLLLDSFRPDVILLDVMLGEVNGFDICQQIRRSSICPEVVIIFVSSLSSLDDKVAAYGAGGDDYLCKPINIQELEQKLISISKRIAYYHELELQCESASQAAFNSMQQSSELGQLIAFFATTMESDDESALYRAIAKFTQGFGSQCTVEFRFGDIYKQWPEGAVTSLESEILELGRNAKRVVSFGNNLLLNSSWCSLLVKHMPVEDPELLGRLRDNYAILLGIIDCRVIWIESNHSRSKERTKAIVALGEAMEFGFGRIRQELRQQELQSEGILRKMADTIDDTLMTMGLTEEQENILLAIFDENRVHLEDIMGLSAKIDNEIRQLVHLLGKID